MSFTPSSGIPFLDNQLSSHKKEEGEEEGTNNLHHQHARRGFTEDLCNPRHLLRVWLQDTENTPKELPLDLQTKFDAMFVDEPDFLPAR